jgi:hypothetical protein
MYARSTTYLHNIVFGLVYYCYFRELKSLLSFYFLRPIGIVPMANKSCL